MVEAVVLVMVWSALDDLLDLLELIWYDTSK